MGGNMSRDTGYYDESRDFRGHHPDLVSRSRGSVDLHTYVSLALERGFPHALRAPGGDPSPRQTRGSKTSSRSFLKLPRLGCKQYNVLEHTEYYTICRAI